MNVDSEVAPSASYDIGGNLRRMLVKSVGEYEIVYQGAIGLADVIYETEAYMLISRVTGV